MSGRPKPPSDPSLSSTYSSGGEGLSSSTSGRDGSVPSFGCGEGLEGSGGSGLEV